MGRRRAAEAERTEVRTRILEAAKAIVSGDGYATLTIRRVADAVGCAPGTIYLYFEGRDEIARQLCLDGFRELLTYMKPAAAVADPLERLSALMRAYCRFGFERPETYRLTFMADPRLAEAVFGRGPVDEPGTGGLEAFGLLVDALRELQVEGRVAAAASVAELADVVWAAAHGAVSLKLTCPSFPATEADTLVDSVVRLACAGVVAT